MADTESSRERVRIILISIISGIFILGIKFYAFTVSGSTALKSDAIESIVNVVAAVFALGAIRYGDKPADKEHPFGHGKIEHFSAAFEGGLISLASVLIMIEAIRTLIEGPKIQALGFGLAINLSAGVLNGLLGWYLVKSGKKHRSRAMEADGWHVLSDFYTTVGIGMALLVVKFTGLLWLDSVIALVVSLMLGRTGYHLVKHSAVALLDSEDPELVAKIVELINEVRPEDIISVHELKTLRSGRYTHVDVHLIVPEFYTAGRAHDVIESFGAELLKAGQLEGECLAHIDPCRMNFCAHCSVNPCPIRQKPFESRPVIQVDQATARGAY